MIKFVNKQSPKDGQWYVAIVAGNNEHWFGSEGYISEENGERSVQDFKDELAKHIRITEVQGGSVKISDLSHSQFTFSIDIPLETIPVEDSGA